MEIISIIESQKDKIKNFGISKIALFGSYSRGEATEKSDIDFLVEFENGKKNFDDFINLAFFLEDIFNKKVEIVTSESIDMKFLEYIKKDLKYANIN
jgi:hypothetical protein